MNDGGQVIMKAEDIVKLAEDLDAVVKRLRALGSAGFTSKPAEAPRAPSGGGIEWRVKEKDSGQNRLANAEDGWAWAFAADVDGKIPTDRAQLIDYLKRYGKVTQAGYEISLSKNGKFLNRKKGDSIRHTLKSK
jgi:hypothetical protein